MISRLAIIAAVSVGGARLGLAESIPTPAPQSRPLLEQLDRESQSLYEEVRRQIVRVEMPVPTSLMDMLARENPAFKWGRQLNEPVRRQLESQQVRSLSEQGSSISAEVTPSGTDANESAPTQSATQPATHPSAVLVPPTTRRAEPTTQRYRLFGVPTGQQDAQGRQGMALMFAPIDETAPTTRFTLQARAKVNTSALILDDEGHLVVPLYLDKEAATGEPITVYGAGGVSCRARFIASDSKMNLTVLKMEQMIGRPAVVAEKRPALGSLVMIVTPNQSTARLAVWTGGIQEFGVVCGLDGKIDGFVRHGQFLNAPMWRPVVRQLIQYQVVKRAELGVYIQEVTSELRQAVPALANRPAIQIVSVTAGKAASKGGLRPRDFILALGKQPVEDVPSFASAIADQNGPTELEILRDGQFQKVTVQLEQK